MAQMNSCPNFNHSNTIVTVRFCTMCGEVVNENIPSRKCTEEEHAKMRRERNEYCIHCGEELIHKT